MDAEQPQPTSFLDVCTAGAPLAAIARCLYNYSSCQDQLHLAHAVGKQYRDLVLREITRLPVLNLRFVGRGASDFRTASRFLLRLDNVHTVWPSLDEYNELCLDADGVMLLRLLPQLKELDLAYCNPEGDCLGLCRSLAALTTLEDLAVPGFFARGFFENEHPQEGAKHLAQLTRLTRLDVRSCLLAPKGVEHTAGLASLRELDMSGHNNLERANLASLTSLTSLDIDDTLVNEQTIASIGTLKVLQHLAMRSVQGLEPSHCVHLRTLRALTSLHLKGNMLGPSCMPLLACIRRLRVLDLSDTNIGGPGAAPLTALKHLHTLSYCRNGLGPEGAMHIGKCTQLQTLRLDSNAVGDEGAAHLAPLTGLQHLSIESNGVGAIGASHIATNLTSMTCLIIDGNAVGDVGVTYLAQLAKLRVLVLDGDDLGVEGHRCLTTMGHRSDLRITISTCREPGDSGGEAY